MKRHNRHHFTVRQVGIIRAARSIGRRYFLFPIKRRLIRAVGVPVLLSGFDDYDGATWVDIAWHWNLKSAREFIDYSDGWDGVEKRITSRKNAKFYIEKRIISRKNARNFPISRLRLHRKFMACIIRTTNNEQRTTESPEG